MKVKLLQKIIVGGVQTPQNAGSVVEVDDNEGRQLIDAGYAEQAASNAKVETLRNDTTNMGTGDYQRFPAGTVNGRGELLAGSALRTQNGQQIDGVAAGSTAAANVGVGGDGDATNLDAAGESTKSTKSTTGGTSTKAR